MKWVKRKIRINGKVYNAEFPVHKKKMQFSQKVCIAGLILVFFAWAGNGILLWCDKMPMSDVTIAIITLFGGFATGGYFALSGVRDCSKNKHGVKEE